MRGSAKRKSFLKIDLCFGCKYPMLSRGYLNEKEAAGISLFLAVILAALLLTNFVLLAGAKNHLLILKAGTKLEQEAERGLSLYNLNLFEDYGLWGMDEALAAYLIENPDVMASFSEIEGCREFHYELSEALWAPMSLKKQIQSFMSARFPAAVAEQLFSVLKNFKTGSASAELKEMENVLQEKELQKGFSDFTSYLEELPEEGEGLGTEASEEKSDAEGNQVDALTFLLMRALQEQIQEATATAIELGVETGGSAVTSQNLFSYLNQAHELLDFNTSATYDKLALNEYALRMFPAQVHVEGLPEDYPLAKSLRGKTLFKTVENEGLSLESLITGERREAAEQKIKSYVFMLRFLAHNVGILMNQKKMADYRSTATTVSLVISAASLGRFSIPPESLVYVIVCVAALKNAGEDVKDLLAGESVPYLPQHEQMKFPSYYHDYLRLFLLTISEEDLLRRLCQNLKAEFGKEFYCSITVGMEWQSPYFKEMKEDFVTRRQYAVYKE